MDEKTQFEELIKSGNPVGEVISVDRFMVRVRGLQPVNTHAVVMFEDGSKGYVHHVYEDYVVILHLGSVFASMGMTVVVQHKKLVTRVGKNYIGRVINVLGEPLDGKGPIEPDGTWPIFHGAPLLYERELLDKPVETGITLLDISLSISRGQRMALLGDGKSGKSSLATQIAINQRSTDLVTIYVLIGKRRADLVELMDRLEKNGAMDKTIVIASTMFESLVVNYLAPYVGAAMGEYFWQHLAQDTFVIYDDLTSHGMAYREISLLSGVSPGRDSYPGDIFYTHSSLLERAGKLNRNHAAQTALPIIYAPGGDITAYLPTNVMSITDGQWILDMDIFREVMRPAISTALSVTRVGGIGQNKRQKALGQDVAKALSAHRQAEEFAHFGSELSEESEMALLKGKYLYKVFNQIIGETYNFMDQQFLLDITLGIKLGETLDVELLKQNVHEYAAQVQGNTDDETSNFIALRDELRAKVISGTPRKTEQEKTDEAATAKAEAADEAEKGAEDDKKEEPQPEPAPEEPKNETTEEEQKVEATPAKKPEEGIPQFKPGDSISPQVEISNEGELKQKDDEESQA